MTLEEMLTNYGGNACVSIEGYCEEAVYDYYTMPLDNSGRPDEDALSDDNPNHYKPSCMAEEPWWEEVKERTVKYWNIIGGGAYKVELTISLENENE